jgi:hypothetical protein
MTITHPKPSAIPVRPSQYSTFTVCMPTGRFIWAMSPEKVQPYTEEEGGSEKGEERRK